MLPFLLVLYFVAFCVYLYRFMTHRPKNFPPGPLRWPIVGSLVQLYWKNWKHPFKAAHDLVKEYNAPMVGLYLGDYLHIIVSDPDLIHELYTKPEFQGRPGGLVPSVRSPHQNKILGVIFTDGDKWSEQKRYALRNFRDLGYGRRNENFEVVLEEETRNLLSLLNDGNSEVCKDGIASMPQLFYMFHINMILNVFDGQRLPLTDLKDVISLTEAAYEFLDATEPTGGVLNLLPWIQYFYPLSQKVKTIIRCNNMLYEFLERLVKRSEENHSSELLRGYIDIFLEKIKNGKNNPESFNEENLRNILLDFLFPAVTTVAAAHGFLFEYLVYHPEVQEKMQEEIDRVVGTSRLPTLHDRKDMPYVEATLREALRLKPVVVFSLPHRSTQTAKLGAYTIPENTTILPDIYGFHLDEKLWNNPLVFDPRRFLDINGKLKKDPSLPFGVGKRVCPGETFARQNLFVSTAAFFQHFSIENAPGCSLPDLQDFRNGLNTSPHPFKVKILPRENKHNV